MPIYLVLSWMLNSALASAPIETDCTQLNTTIEISECYARAISRAESTQQRYLTAAEQRYVEDADVRQQITLAQQHWQAYRVAHCASQYEIWREGSIRSVIAARCHLRLVEQRTLQLWEDYLTYMDSSPAILSKPMVTD